MKGDLLNNSINVNTQNMVTKLKSSEPILSLAVKQGNLKILGARYHLDSGVVKVME
jgi:carbonic anhydrase